MKKINIYLLAIFTVLGIAATAQTGINSPYSRYGLGQLNSDNTNAVALSMGGLMIGMHDATTLNPGNPASYGSLDSSSFLFEIGISSSITTLKTTQLSESGYDATLSYIYAGFPVTRWWKSGVGIMPYSKIGYNIEVKMSVPNFSDVVSSFVGDGGLDQVFYGNAFNITKKFRAGVNIKYLFGQSTRSSMVNYPDSILIFGTKVESKVRGGDFIFDYGLQYDININSTTNATIGVIYANKFNLKASRNYISKTISGGYNGTVEYVKDTIEYRPDEQGTIIIPERFGVGFSVKKNNSWRIGGDFEWQQWKQFEAFGVKDSLENSFHMVIGGELMPKHTTISPLYKRLKYRAGIRYEQSYLRFNNTNVNEFGISFGIGFPMKMSKTDINLGFEIGKRGTTKNSLIQENFFNIFLGVSIQEKWFQKRKYQ